MKTNLNKEQRQLLISAIEDKCASLMARLVNPDTLLDDEKGHGKEKVIKLYNNYSEILKLLKEGNSICITDN